MVGIRAHAGGEQRVRANALPQATGGLARCDEVGLAVSITGAHAQPRPQRWVGEELLVTRIDRTGLRGGRVEVPEGRAEVQARTTRAADAIAGDLAAAAGLRAAREPEHQYTTPKYQPDLFRAFTQHGDLPVSAQ